MSPTSDSHASSFSEQSGKLADDVRELGHMAVDSASRAVRSAKERGSRSLEQGRERVGAAGRGLGTFVLENPVPSVLIALGVGALVALALRGRG